MRSTHLCLPRKHFRLTFSRALRFPDPAVAFGGKQILGIVDRLLLCNPTGSRRRTRSLHFRIASSCFLISLFLIRFFFSGVRYSADKRARA